MTILFHALLLLLLSGCASVRGYNYDYVSCEGEPQRIWVEEYTTMVPFLECPRLAALAGASVLDVLYLMLGAIGCTIQTPGWAIVVTPPWDVIREHELAHVAGRHHFALLPIGQGCPSEMITALGVQ